MPSLNPSPKVLPLPSGVEGQMDRGSGADPPGPLGKGCCWLLSLLTPTFRHHPSFIPAVVLQVLLQQVLGHLRCSQHDSRHCVMEPIPHQGLHVLQL